MTQASGAGRTGLDRVIELTAAGAAADAFVAVALAGTLFFSTSVDQARGRIALTLLITMAPFAVLAPFIGPMLDRVRDGRRYIMIGTLLARGLLCWGMAGAVQHSDTVTLLPAAFGVLVLQKAYGVTRSSVTPRVLPAKITLVSANARISLAALIASTVGVGVAGASRSWPAGAPPARPGYCASAPWSTWPRSRSASGCRPGWTSRTRSRVRRMGLKRAGPDRPGRRAPPARPIPRGRRPGGAGPAAGPAAAGRSAAGSAAGRRGRPAARRMGRHPAQRGPDRGRGHAR